MPTKRELEEFGKAVISDVGLTHGEEKEVKKES